MDQVEHRVHLLAPHALRPVLHKERPGQMRVLVHEQPFRDPITLEEMRESSM